MNWLRRIREWRAAVKLAGKEAKLLPMLRALLTGRVRRKTWRRRIQTCLRCPLYDREGKRCGVLTVGGKDLGCGCYVPFLALTREPYPGGCWGRAAIGKDFGWGAVA